MIDEIRKKEFEISKIVSDRINENGGLCILTTVGKIIITRIIKQPTEYFYIQFDSIIVGNTYFTMPKVGVSISSIDDLAEFERELETVKAIIPDMEAYKNMIREFAKSKNVRVRI